MPESKPSLILIHAAGPGGRMWRPTGPDGWRWWMRSSAWIYGRCCRGSIHARTLVVCGRRDRRNLADSRLAADLIPGALHMLVPHVGHSWPVFAPVPFNAIVQGFLTQT